MGGCGHTEDCGLGLVLATLHPPPVQTFDELVTYNTNKIVPLGVPAMLGVEST